MKKYTIAFMMTLSALSLEPRVHAQTGIMTKDQIIAVAEKAALAQIEHVDFRYRSWKHGAFWIGVVQLDKVSDNPELDEALEKMAHSQGVRNVGVGVLKQHSHAGHAVDPHHADDFAMGQAFLDYALVHKEREVAADTMKRTEEVTDHILSEEAAAAAARFDELATHEGLTWSWIDALFMAAPLHARMTEVTRDPKYLNSMLVEWKRVSDNLYDTEEHLYYRDKEFLTRTSRNGKKVFWGRGNGWVMGAFANALPYVPANHPQRAWMVAQFREMADKLAEIQNANGSWSPSLIDYDHFPYSEMSSTAFFCFGIAWGVNNDILDRAKFRPVAEKAWAAMLAARLDDGQLGYIQGVGASPARVQPQTTALYGNGAFILTALQMAEMAPIRMPVEPEL